MRISVVLSNSVSNHLLRQPLETNSRLLDFHSLLPERRKWDGPRCSRRSLSDGENWPHGACTESLTFQHTSSCPRGRESRRWRQIGAGAGAPVGRRHPSRATQLSAACLNGKLPSTAALGSRLQATGGEALCDPGRGSPPAHGHRWARSRHPTKAPLSPGPRVLLISLGLSARENIHAVLQLEVVPNLPF